MLLIRFSNRLKRESNQHWVFFYFIFFSAYFFYTIPAYAACSGLGCSCSVSPTGVAFMNYDPTSGTAKTSTGNVAVTCSALVLFTASYVISFNTGNSGSYATRFMNLSSNHLNYNLYTQAARTTIWGNGTAGTATVSDSYTAVVLAPVTRNYTVFGLLPALQAVPAGAYSDIITVTVTY